MPAILRLGKTVQHARRKRDWVGCGSGFFSEAPRSDLEACSETPQPRVLPRPQPPNAFLASSNRASGGCVCGARARMREIIVNSAAEQNNVEEQSRERPRSSDCSLPHPAAHSPFTVLTAPPPSWAEPGEVGTGGAAAGPVEDGQAHQAGRRVAAVELHLPPSAERVRARLGEGAGQALPRSSLPADATCCICNRCNNSRDTLIDEGGIL